jgi:hypothetical protein
MIMILSLLLSACEPITHTPEPIAPIPEHQNGDLVYQVSQADGEISQIDEGKIDKSKKSMDNCKSQFTEHGFLSEELEKILGRTIPVRITRSGTCLPNVICEEFNSEDVYKGIACFNKEHTAKTLKEAWKNPKPMATW